MRPLRYVMLAALAGLVALPVADVHTSAAPQIDKLEVRSDVLTAMQGRGVPGTSFEVWYRRRPFHAGTPEEFQYCAGLYPDEALPLSTTVTVDQFGGWRITGLWLAVSPQQPPGHPCDGLLTDLEIRSMYGAVVPRLQFANLYMPEGGQTASAAGGIAFADRVAVGIADGPDEVMDVQHPWPVDTSEDGIDLCASAFGCGATVSWRVSDGTFVAPKIRVYADGSPGDREFPQVSAMIQAHRPGGSFLAVTRRPRPIAVWASPFSLNVKAVRKLNNCDSVGFFDFL